MPGLTCSNRMRLMCVRVVRAPNAVCSAQNMKMTPEVRIPWILLSTSSTPASACNTLQDKTVPSHQPSAIGQPSARRLTTVYV